MSDSIDSIIDKRTDVRCVLVSAVPSGVDQHYYEASLDELERLADTAGAVVCARLIQNKQSPDPATYIGSGKLTELAELCRNNEVTLAVFDCELSPSQIRNIEDGLGDGITAIDRSMLILDIFALHATTAEGKLQVELAQLKYTVPRLIGKGKAMSRLGGGIGTRGPGESQLETDKRHIKRRMDALEDELKSLKNIRAVQRAQRDSSGIFKIAIAGYTNAGKSTILNYLTDAGILAQDMLFATLDPTTRKYELPCGQQVLLTDTVGFIRNLPHHLIEAFRSTLDEVVYADAVMVVIDSSDPEAYAQLEVTRSLIEDLGAGAKPILYVCNKSDIAEPVGTNTVTADTVFVSAKTGEGMDTLVAALERMAQEGKKKYTFFFCHNDAGMVNFLYSSATDVTVEYLADGISATAVCDAKTAGKLKRFIKD